MLYKYILDGHTPVPTADMAVWDKWFRKSNRVVAKTKVKDCEVSTVFLGLDHSFGGGRPLLFETMIFGGKRDQECYRYSTWEEAKEGHKQVVKSLKEQL